MVGAGGRRVLVAGGVGVDTIVRVPSLPLAMADSIHVRCLDLDGLAGYRAGA